MIDKKNDIEFASPEEIKQFQEGKLQQALLYLQQNSRFYQRMFERYGIKVEKIRTIEDLVNIPFTEKKDLQLFNEDTSACRRRKLSTTSPPVARSATP